MTPKTLMLLAIGAAAAIAPAAASAQSYYDPYRQRPYEQRAYDPYQRGYLAPPRGDFDQGRRGGYGAYPRFRGIEQHIRAEIIQGVRDDLIERDDARDLLDQLRDIQAQEWREYRVHGWNLPYDDQARIQARLNALDRLVDQIRDQQ